MDAVELSKLGVRYYQEGNIEESIKYLELAIGQAQREGEDSLSTELLARNNLSEAYMRIGECISAAQQAMSSLSKAKAAKRPIFLEYEVEAIGRLTMALQITDLRGRWAEIKDQLLDGIDKARGIDLLYWIVQNYETLGTCAARLKEFMPSQEWLQEALNALSPKIVEKKVVEEKIGVEEHFFRTRIYQGFSDLARLRNDQKNALLYAETALGTAQSSRVSSPHLISGAKLTLARAHMLQGEKADALQIVESVMPLARSNNWKVEEQQAEYLRGELLRDLGIPDEALQAANRALSLSKKIQMKEEEVACLISVAQAFLMKGARSDSDYHFEAALKLARERNYSDYLSQIQDLTS